MTAGSLTDVPKEIERILKDTGLTLPDLARKTPIKERTIRAWRSGENVPNLEMWEMFKNAVANLKS